MNLKHLRNRHLGETIWVMGSGPTLNFLHPEFFADKIVVSTNYSANTLGFIPQYVFGHYHDDILTLVHRKSVLVTLAKHYETKQSFPEPKPENIILIEHESYDPPGAEWNPLTTHQPSDNSLVFGSSSFHGAMHLAAWLGGKHLVLVGADCGTLDGENRVAGYVQGDTPWAIYNQHHLLMKQFLMQEYGVTVYSLNPFINFNLEGHTFSGV